MSLHFPYKLQAFNKPLITLGGRYSRPRPRVTISVFGPTQHYVLDAVIDTGADDTVFPDWVAAHVGIDLNNAPCGQGEGVATGVIPLRYAEVTLRIADNHEQREWRAWVGFTSAPLKRPLLGFAGFLQFFTAIFYGDREEVELAVNSLYPGT